MTRALSLDLNGSFSTGQSMTNDILGSTILVHTVYFQGTIAVNFALYFITEIITAAKLVYTPSKLNITFWGKGELYVLS